MSYFPSLLHCARWKRVPCQLLLLTAPGGHARSRMEPLSPPPHGHLLRSSPITSPSPQSLQPPQISKNYLPLRSAPRRPPPNSQIHPPMAPRSHLSILYLKLISQKIPHWHQTKTPLRLLMNALPIKFNHFPKSQQLTYPAIVQQTHPVLLLKSQRLLHRLLSPQ